MLCSLINFDAKQIINCSNKFFEHPHTCVNETNLNRYANDAQYETGIIAEQLFTVQF